MYHLRGDEIVRKHFILRYSSKHRIQCQDIGTWQRWCVGGMGSGVEIKFVDGRFLPCGDRFGQLAQILGQVAPSKELPFEIV